MEYQVEQEVHKKKVHTFTSLPVLSRAWNSSLSLEAERKNLSKI